MFFLTNRMWSTQMTKLRWSKGLLTLIERDDADRNATRYAQIDRIRTCYIVLCYVALKTKIEQCVCRFYGVYWGFCWSSPSKTIRNDATSATTTVAMATASCCCASIDVAVDADEPDEDDDELAGNVALTTKLETENSYKNWLGCLPASRTTTETEPTPSGSIVAKSSACRCTFVDWVNFLLFVFI